MSAVGGLLNVNLIDLIATGWRKHQELTAAARRTLDLPDSTEVVRLVDHQITVTEQPYVVVKLNGDEVARLDLRLSLIFDVSELIALISYGTVIALRSGSCDVTAALAIEGINALTRTAPLDLPGVIMLHQGIRLLNAEEYPARPDQARPGDHGPAGAAVRMGRGAVRVRLARGFLSRRAL